MAECKRSSDADGAPVTEEELEQALSVLAGSDPENCSYSRGYVKRQAVFACNTCTPNAAEPAGVCLACANKCHDGHDIFELYTKRNFRCDCGNGRFGDFQCQLTPAKDEENSRNRYDHNFNGCYCTCDRPYPDTDEQDDDEMIQCVVCEDWFHSRHLGCTVVEPEELQEMVCETCMNKAPFLWTYAAHFAVPPVINISHPDEDIEVDVEEEKGEQRQTKEEEPTTSNEHIKHEKAYVAADVQFLMDQSDTILAYEKKGLVEPFGQHPLMALTSSLDRVQQLEVIYGFNELTTSISAFLEQFVSEGKTVTVEAVHEFFEELRARKKRRTNAGHQ
ncbi:putative E3 ubiquitin-protein ligase UBR7 isoform X2 [Leuresthes tenuis]|uniref:putative E3 ubiquitin-protein ligase UBR7 isoform X2 n=1 Tax=Leuresthes tenuis TaxID=355514 RepID=UPI003B5014E3